MSYHVDHPNPSFYQVTLRQDSEQAIINQQKIENKLLLGRTGLAVESDVNQKESNHQKKIADSYFDIDISPIDHSESSSSLTAKSKERIPLAKLNVNNTKSLGEKDFIVGKMITEPIQPADRFVKNPDDTLNQDFDNNLIVDYMRNSAYQRNHGFVNVAYAADSDSSTIGGVHSATPEVSLSPTNNVTLVLSQSFDNGWKAYQVTNDLFLDSWYMKLLIPFFHKELPDHVLVNNWENGWQISDQFLVISSQQNRPTTDNRQLQSQSYIYHSIWNIPDLLYYF